VAVTARKADRVTLSADMDRDGYVVLIETHDPGWRVRVDGIAQPLLVANGAFRAVWVPGGRHLVEMSYRPWTALAGAALTLGGAVLAAVFCRWHRGSAGYRT
jgi:uncharacterized membrane protein YfhO